MSSPDRSRAPAGEPTPSMLAEVGAAVRRVALQRNSRDVSRVIAASLPGLLDADRATCLLVDLDGGSIWVEADDPVDDYDRPADRGVIAHVARARTPLIVDAPGMDERFDPRVDEPAGSASDRLLLCPVLGAGGEVHAVLVVARAGGAPFGPLERDLIVAFAARVGPLLDAVSWAADAVPAVQAGVFRPEALQAHGGRRDEGDVVRVHSAWVRIAYWLILSFFFATAGYLGFARVGEYASGPAVVVSSSRTDVTAPTDGVLADVLVRPGDPVAAGQVVARLRDREAEAELAAVEEQAELRLAERLMDPTDRAAEQALILAMAAKQSARRSLERHVLRAPVAGVAREVLLTSGASVAAGQSVLSLVAREEEMVLVAAIPAGFRPLLEKGMTARVELAGHTNEYFELTVHEISTEAFGPAAARRRLGALLGDALPVAGSVIFVELELPADGFEADGKSLRFHHGMLARVELRMSSEPLLTALIPGLKDLL